MSKPGANRSIISLLLSSLLGAWVVLTPQARAETPDRPPNLIIIFTDDQGYNDLGCQGSTTIKTPNLDRMADQGLRLTSFYAQPVCGVSRAALMTGSYPIRVGEPGNIKRLHTVPHPEEITMAEVLGAAGYATALIGKWHLCQPKADAPGGFDPSTMPNAQGFDYFYGTPLYNGFTVFVEDTNFRSPIFRNTDVVVEAVDSWDHITQDHTREATAWIEQNREQPFFLYLAHNLPHIPVGASEDFKGKSAYGPYGDTIEEIDWSCGEILRKLEELGLDENTLVVFTSDNGPWVETTRGMKPDGKPFIPRDHSGSADPLRGWKMSAWDGGSRVPCIVRWPGHIAPGGVSDELLSTMDLLPTFAALAGAEPSDRELDGRDASAFLLGQTDVSPREDYFYYTGCLLTGVRSGSWKLVLPRVDNPPGTGWWGRMIEGVPELTLFDLAADPGETTNVASDHPEVVEDLLARIERARAELGDIDRTGSGARFFDEGQRRLQVPVRIASQAAVEPKYDEFQPLGELRFTFESGQLEGWRLVEGQLGKPVSDAVSLPRWKQEPYNREGRFHLSTVRTDTAFADAQTGTLESPRFTIHGEQAAFLVSGGFDKHDLYVALCDGDSGEPLLQAGGSGGASMRRVIWDVEPFQGREVFLRVVDRRASDWGHLTFDDFSVDGRLVEPDANWPEFQAGGQSDSTDLPLTFSDTENVAWKTPIHDVGWSSPVVWGDQIWMTTATEDGKQTFAVCVDRRSGAILHDVKIFDVEEPQDIDQTNSYASPTPAIEQGRVYVHFGSVGTAALNTDSGKILWTQSDIDYFQETGSGSSPILFDDKLIFNADGIDTQSVVALDKQSGKVAWRTARSVDYTGKNPKICKAFATPRVIDVEGKRQLVSCGAWGVMGYDPNSGVEIWKVRHTGWSMIARPLGANGLVFVTVDYVHPAIWAIRPNGRGDVTDSHVAWKLEQSVPGTSSFLLIDDLLYMVSDKGIAQCVEAASGEVVWKERVEGNYAASPIFADGRIYLSSKQGVVTVLASGREFTVLAVNELDDQIMASPVVSDNAIFLRTKSSLYRFEK